jgi:hypothetical protein
MEDKGVGPYAPSDCEVSCEVGLAYPLRKEQKGGKPTSAFPQLIHGYGAKSNIFHNHFFLGNLLNIMANSTAMSSRRHGVIQNMNSMISSFSEIFSIRPTYFISDYFYNIFNPYLIIMQSVAPAKSISTHLVQGACGITPRNVQ